MPTPVRLPCCLTRSSLFFPGLIVTLAFGSAGGGRKVIRCELSLDGGDTWRLAGIQRHEKATPYNKYWCWVFWSVDVPAVDLLRSAEIRVRAVDSSNNLMPEKCAVCHLLKFDLVTVHVHQHSFLLTRQGTVSILRMTRCFLAACASVTLA